MNEKGDFYGMKLKFKSMPGCVNLTRNVTVCRSYSRVFALILSQNMSLCVGIIFAR